MEKEQLRVCLFVLGHDDEHANGERKESVMEVKGVIVSIVRFQGENGW